VQKSDRPGGAGARPSSGSFLSADRRRNDPRKRPDGVGPVALWAQLARQDISHPGRARLLPSLLCNQASAPLERRPTRSLSHL